MVVRPDATVEQRMVKASERVGNLWVIDSGVKPGEKVIVEGIQKVSPGVQVSAQTIKPEEETPLAPNGPPAENKAKAAAGK
jgi:membrane fusion protein (multidrug efflux system)